MVTSFGEVDIQSGIYKINNLLDNKCYIGSTSNIINREKQHWAMLKSNKHHSIKLQNAYNKYGQNTFTFQVVEYCEKEVLLDKEQIWMDKEKSFNNGYNCSKSSRHMSEKVKTSVYLNNKIYIDGFINNMERLFYKSSIEVAYPPISFFGFNVNKTKQQNALFKRYWQASNIMLGIADDIHKLDVDKEYRINSITYYENGTYHMEENTSNKSPMHDRQKSKEVLSVMLADLLETMAYHRYGKTLLSEYKINIEETFCKESDID